MSPFLILKVTRQFPLTCTDHVPLFFPFNSCKFRPDRSISLTVLDVARSANIRLSLVLCLGWIPEIPPLSNNIFRPLCLKLLITNYSVTHNVSGFNQNFPYDILSWSETYPSGSGKNAKVLTTEARRTHAVMVDYWNKNSVKDLKLRKELEKKGSDLESRIRNLLYSLSKTFLFSSYRDNRDIHDK